LNAGRSGRPANLTRRIAIVVFWARCERHSLFDAYLRGAAWRAIWITARKVAAAGRRALSQLRGGVALPPKSPGNAQIDDERGAKCGAFCGASGAVAPEGGEWQEDAPDAKLVEVAESWATLPEAIRAGILALVRAAR
jgi:hypothetical protein